MKLKDLEMVNKEYALKYIRYVDSAYFSEMLQGETLKDGIY